MAQRQRRPCNVLYDWFIDPTSTTQAEGASPTATAADNAASRAVAARSSAPTRGAFWDWWAQQNARDGIAAAGHDPRIDYDQRVAMVREQFGEDAAAALRSWTAANPASMGAATPAPTGGVPAASDRVSTLGDTSPDDDPTEAGSVTREGQFDRWRVPMSTVPLPPARVRWHQNKAWTSPARNTSAPIVIPPAQLNPAKLNPAKLNPAADSEAEAPPADQEQDPERDTEQDAAQDTAVQDPIPGSIGEFLQQQVPAVHEPNSAAKQTSNTNPAPRLGWALEQPADPTAAAEPPVAPPVDFETPIRVLHPEPHARPPGTGTPTPDTQNTVAQTETEALLQAAQASLDAPHRAAAPISAPVQVLPPEQPNSRETAGNLLISLGVLILVGLFVIWMLF